MALSIKERAQKVKALIFDVDGVLTGGHVIYGPDGEWKAFHVHDGHGFAMARQAGLKLALLTGRASEAVRRRAGELQVDILEEGVQDKGLAMGDLLRKLSVRGEEACYVGDDLVDIPAMIQVGFPVAVENAPGEVKAHAAWTTKKKGGDGAAREVIELILQAKSLWRDMVARYEGNR